MSKPDDNELVRRCRKGDREAFTTLLVRYEKPVFNAAYRMLNSREDAQDVTQAVFLKTYEKLDGFNSNYRFFSWIYRIALNESIDCLNRRNRSEGLQYEPLSETTGPAQAAELSERRRQIESALMGIKAEYRAVIVLKHFLDCNYTEISEILDIPESKVKSRLYSARQRLKEILAEVPDKT